MKPAQMQSLAIDIAEMVRGYVDRAFLKVLPGKTAFQIAVEHGFAGTETQWVASLRGERGERGEAGVGSKGDKGDPGATPDAQALLASLKLDLKSLVDALPRPKNGDAGAQGPKGEQGPQGKQGERGEAGMSPDPNALLGSLRRELVSLVDAIPKAKDGAPGPKGEQGAKGEPGRSSDDEAIIECLKLELKSLVDALPGPVPGARGEPGAPGRDAAAVDMFEVQEMVDRSVSRAVAAIPKAKDGEHGRDALQIDVLPMLELNKGYARGTYGRAHGGTLRAFRNTDPIPAFKLGEDKWEKSGWEVCLNGVALESEEVLDEGRLIKRVTIYTDGTQFSRELRTTLQLWRGVWSSERQYWRGDTVTWDGSNWHCEMNEAREKPGRSEQWKLMVKSGRDGRDFDDPAKKQARADPVRTK